MIQFPKQESNVQLQICLTSKLCIAIIAHMHKECPQFPSCRDLRFPVLYPQPAFFLFLHPLWECTPISARNIKLTNRISRNSLLVVISAFPFFIQNQHSSLFCTHYGNAIPVLHRFLPEISSSQT